MVRRRSRRGRTITPSDSASTSKVALAPDIRRPRRKPFTPNLLDLRARRDINKGAVALRANETLGELVVQRFMAEKNIQNFKVLLERETDEAQRAVLMRMIREEEAKLAALPPSGLFQTPRQTP